MPYEIETKDGIVIRGIPDDVAADHPSVKAKVDAARASKAGPDEFDRSVSDPTSGMSTFDKAAAGVGKAIVDTGRGLGQMVGATSRDDVAESRKRDAALMDTGAGFGGNLAGNIALFLAPGGILKGAAMAARGAGAAKTGQALSAAGTAALTPKTVSAAVPVGMAMGAVQPSADTGETLANTAVGGAASGVFPALTRIGRTAKAALEPFYESGKQQILGRLYNRAAGDGVAAAAARAAMEKAQVLVPGSLPTAAQASGNAGIAALERTASAIDPTVTTAFAKRLEEQNAARVAVIRRFAGTDAERDAAVAAREATTGDLRNAALKNADYGTTKTAEMEGRIAGKQGAVVSALQDEGRFATRAAEQEHLANNWIPVPGLPRAPGRYAPNAARVPEAEAAADAASGIVTQRKAERDFLGRQLDSLKQAGYSPLNAGEITDSISGTLSQPGKRASTVVQKTLGDVKAKLSELADANGHISADDLYTVRKELGNTISTHAKDTNNWDKKLTAGLERDIQKAIDAQMRKAGAGGLWDDYLAKYQELSRPINQMDVGREIADKSIDKLTGQVQPRAFAKSLSDATAQRATGYGKATLDKTLEPAQLARLNAVKDDISRAVAALNVGRGPGSDTVQKLAYSNFVDASGVPTFIRSMKPVQAIGGVAGAAADALYGRANKEMAARLAQSGLDPASVAAAMKLAANPGGEKLVNLIAGGGSAVGRTAALALLNAHQ